MATQILMPALSPTMEEGTLAKWLVKEGDTVTSGMIIAEIETDKATMEFEAVDEGTMGKILVAEGTEGVKVNTPIAVLVEEGESADDLAAEPAPKAEAKAAPESPVKADAPVAAQPAAELPPVPQPDWPEGTKMKSMTVREALREAMAEEMRKNENVFLMGEEVGEYQGAYKISQGLLDEFGARRVIDTPITEAGFAGLAVGAAWGGLNPIVEFMTFNFAMQAIDHLINSAAKTNYMSGGQLPCPVVFRGPNGAAARVAAQHSQDYAAWYSHVPGLKVVMPYSAADAKGLLKSAIRDGNPVVFLENEILYGRTFEVPDVEDFTVPIGKADVVREGNAVTIVTYGTLVLVAQAAAERAGVDAEIIDLRTLVPYDIETIARSVNKTGRCIVAQEAPRTSGFAAELAAQIQEECFYALEAPIQRVTGWDTPYPHAHEWSYFPGPERFINAMNAVLEA